MSVASLRCPLTPSPPWERVAEAGEGATESTTLCFAHCIRRRDLIACTLLAQAF